MMYKETILVIYSLLFNLCGVNFIDIAHCSGGKLLNFFLHEHNRV